MSILQKNNLEQDISGKGQIWERAVLERTNQNNSEQDKSSLQSKHLETWQFKGII